ncbi:peroxiredoxin [Myxococcota bacterium]|nr:peroxiredoxin [Myxococcota bacterium]
MKPGTPAPDFTLPDQDGRPVSLSDWKGKWTVLYFYPKDNTPGCTLEGQEFTALLPRFSEAGAEVFGVSRDSGKIHCGFAQRYGLAVRLLSDTDHAVHAAYGAWGVKKRFGISSEGALRTTFLIGPDLRIAAAWTAVKAVGHAQEVLMKLSDLKKG